VVEDREALQRAYRDAEERFATEVPRPPHWGGFRLHPERIEFWQGHVARLHDRLRFRLHGDGRWLLERLAP
jgi:pyridoxamine 5'-phosphate oxidase